MNASDLSAGLCGAGIAFAFCLAVLPFVLSAVLEFSEGVWRFLLSDLWDAWRKAWRDVRDHLRGPQ